MEFHELEESDDEQFQNYACASPSYQTGKISPASAARPPVRGVSRMQGDLHIWWWFLRGAVQRERQTLLLLLAEERIFRLSYFFTFAEVQVKSRSGAVVEWGIIKKSAAAALSRRVFRYFLLPVVLSSGSLLPHGKKA
uniref:Uncharacterized protein ORF137 n=1 Tax=Nothoceros aenigmaticus TaxID=13813 RepID=C3RYM6_9EMBR|nr:hypothetical protein MeaeMp20 [Nothoceros aenigmaticus]ACC86782.1 hypothetical protein MeaeMp20 [Nothoceros aenigmaticus]